MKNKTYSPYFHFAFLAIVCFSVFSNNYHHAYNLDSGHIALENPYIRSLKYIPQYFIDPSTFSTLRANVDYRPVLQVTYALNYWMGGYDTFWWHFSQIFIHLCCVMGLYFFTKIVLEKFSNNLDQQAIKTIPFFAALIFSLHPCVSGVVNYFSARSSMLTATFLLPAFITYIKSEGKINHRKYWDSLGYFTLALFTKVEAVAALAVFFFVEMMIKNNRSANFFKDIWNILHVHTFKKLIPFLAVASFYFIVRSIVMSDFDFADSRHSADVGSFEYLITQTTAWWHYIYKWFIPLNLVADDLTFPVFKSLLQPEVIMAISGWALVFLLLLKTWKTQPHIVFFALSGFALISPTSSIAPLSEMVNEHRPYLPLAIASLAWICPATLFIFKKVNESKLSGFMYALILIMILASFTKLTYERNTVFTTEKSYWADIVSKAPSSRAYVNYGLTFMSEGDWDNAYDYFNKSLELAPYWHIPNINLGIVYEHFENDSMALYYYTNAVNFEQFSGHALKYRGNFYLKKREYEKAIEDFTNNIKLSTYFYDAYKGIATGFAGLGNDKECLNYTLKCMKLDSILAVEDVLPISTPFWNDSSLYQSGINYYTNLNEYIQNQWWIYHNISQLSNFLNNDSLSESALKKANELKDLSK